MVPVNNNPGEALGSMGIYLSQAGSEVESRPPRTIAMKATSESLWNLSPADFPSEGTPMQQWEFLLRYAILAPSSHNTQPWLFRVRPSFVEIHADRTRACPVVDPNDRELIMSCGCALYHLRCALRHFGLLGEVEILPDHNPNLLARVHRGTEGEFNPIQSQVFEAIPRRRTNRQPFDDAPLPDFIPTLLQASAESEGVSLRNIPDEPTRLNIAALISHGDRRQWSNPAFRIELSHWVHANHSLRQDGIPGYAVGVDDLLSNVGPLVVRTFDLGEGEAAHDEELAMGSPGLVALSTRGDSPADWIAAGQALASVLLHARTQDIWGSFLNQPIEDSDLRSQLTQFLGIEGFPQCLLRLGFGTEVKPTPRRGLDDLWIA